MFNVLAPKADTNCGDSAKGTENAESDRTFNDSPNTKIVQLLRIFDWIKWNLVRALRFCLRFAQLLLDGVVSIRQSRAGAQQCYRSQRAVDVLIGRLDVNSSSISITSISIATLRVTDISDASILALGDGLLVQLDNASFCTNI